MQSYSANFGDKCGGERWRNREYCLVDCLLFQEDMPPKRPIVGVWQDLDRWNPHTVGVTCRWVLLTAM